MYEYLIELLLFPAFLIFFIYIMGKQFHFWDKYWPKIQGRIEKVELPKISKGLSTIDFKGLNRVFKK